MKRSELISIRDTIQSIWVAIVLAFVLRAFVLEAFVIPTGSMAPRLMGRHVVVQCPDCGYEFPRGVEQGKRPASIRFVCPNCGNRGEWKNPQFKGGDRVLVLKLPEKVRPLRRWDVVVFKDPQGNIQNYIKRLVGLPGEALRIVHGDIFTHPLDDRNGDGVRDEGDLDDSLTDLAEWTIARKPHATQEAMWQLIFDNDYQPANKPSRSTPWEPLWATAKTKSDAWDLTVQHGRVFAFDGKAGESLQFARGQREVFEASNAYNPQPDPGRPKLKRIDQNDLCSDLKLETTIIPQSDSGSLRLTLSSFSDEFAAEIYFDGRVRLLRRKLGANNEPRGSWAGAETWASTSVKPFAVGRAAPVALTHADWRVSLLIDGEPVLVSTDRQYPPDMELLERARGVEKFVPAPRVGVDGIEGKFQLWRTRVMRDVFYTDGRLSRERGVPPELDYAETYFAAGKRGPIAKSGYPGWGTRTNPIALRKFDANPDLDEFYMLGDNSPASKDSRRWLMASPTLRLLDEADEPQYRLGTVPRYNLIGKAFFVYWPAGSPLPLFSRLPLVPNVGKMRRID